MTEALRAAPEGSEDRKLAGEFDDAKRAAEAASEFVRASGRFPLTAVGDVNTYALFAETLASAVAGRGRVGAVFPTAIATDLTTADFFSRLCSKGRADRLLSFTEVRHWFVGTDDRKPFCLLTLARDAQAVECAFAIRKAAQLSDTERRFHMTYEDIRRINPNTKTIPTFRSRADASIASKIHRRVPILFEEGQPDRKTWEIRYHGGLHMSGASGSFRTATQLALCAEREGQVWKDRADGTWMPLVEAKMIHQFNHRWGSFEMLSSRPNNAPLPQPTLENLCDPSYEVAPWYWVKVHRSEDVENDPGWVLVWRDGGRNTDIRTLIAAVLPRGPIVGDLPSFSVLNSPRHAAAMLVLLNSLVLDFLFRAKFTSGHVKQYHLHQIPVPAATSLGDTDLSFIAVRAVELIYTSYGLTKFAQDLGYDGPPFRWDPERRAVLRGELDAYCAYLYGLTREELCYILDPKAVKGEDFPSETFRVLKQNEERPPPLGFGEYQTQRLVLEAFDRFASDGTFDPAKLEDPIYFPVLQKAYAEKSRAYAELEATHRDLLARADQQPKPTLFVEGRSDVPVIEAAWSVFFPDEPMPFAVLAAGGTTQMGSLAGKGKALRDVLGDRLVCALADNDGEGRELWDNGLFRKGGVWRMHPNGIWWCLLQPRPDFRTVMERFEIPEKAFPFTLEAAFPPAIRRQAMTEGAYVLSDEPQTDLTMEPAPVKKLFAEIAKLDPEDDARLELLAPHHSCKEPFAAWITRPERRTPEIYAAFETVMRGLKELMDKHSKGELGPPQRPAAE